MNIDKSKENHCGYNDFKRARYFDGELMNKQIFAAEQLYHNEKRRLINRMLHGWGVVCGLKVKPTNPPGPNIIVEPGMALDCHGNEILVCEEQTVDLSVKPCISKTERDPCADYNTTEQKPAALYMVIRYQESPSDPMPVYASSGSCEEKTCDHSRTREGFCIEVWDEPPRPISSKPHTTDMPDMLCSEPFPCPPPTCCPNPHYILLATISCGPRDDRIFSKCTIKDQNNQQREIRYQIKRSLPKVCISNVSPNNVISDINDVYTFETDYDFSYDRIEWKIKWDQLGDEFESDKKIEETLSDYILRITNYTITAKSNAKGPVYMKIPVCLSFFSGEQKIDACDLTFQSPVYIGITEPKRGSTISAAMIRNIEHKKFVITFPLLSWLLTSSGRKEGQILSGNVNSFCELMEKWVFPRDEEMISAKVPRDYKVAEGRIKEDIEKQLKDWTTNVDERIEKKIKEMKALGTEIKKISTDIKNIKADVAKKQDKTENV